MSISFRFVLIALYISSVVFAVMVLQSGMSGFGMFPVISVTSAPRDFASSARYIPVFPEPGFVMILMGSMYSIVGPAVISIFFFLRSFFLNLSHTVSIMMSVDCRRALFPTISGSMNIMPRFFRRSMFSIIAGLSYMDSCIAGTIMMGISDPCAVVAKVVTVVSSIPHAILDIVFAVAGAIMSKSALFSCLPQSCTCSILPVSSVMHLLPVAHSIRCG